MMDGLKQLDEEALQDLYAWIDKIPLSRPKRNITRDFSDGVMTAEVVKHFFPKLVELHNYTPAHSTQQKLSNWSTLNRQDLEYYSTTNGPPRSDNHPIVIEAIHTNPATVKKKGNVSSAAALGPNVDPAVRLLLEEKEQAILALQETVEILQIKVNRLEHLVHLKDLRIEDLTKHLERYKAHNS
ncbi:hypothetical protein cypCar_00003625 [Cyprinus carpio]|nr:hypothetical protein cypCar_00003625 [Cyprinus carpio]